MIECVHYLVWVEWCNHMKVQFQIFIELRFGNIWLFIAYDIIQYNYFINPSFMKKSQEVSKQQIE